MNSILKLSFFLFFFGFLQGSPTAPRKKGYGPGEQEWGFIDVRPGAHMFYWLFYVQDPKVNSFYQRPLVIWLQGGPGGSSSAFGNFEEIGPLFINGTARPTSWAKHVNLLFIDNPVGAGFSYVDNLNLLTRTNDQIGKDMVSFLTAFYKQFPKFEKTPFYIYCESYGGKMAVEIAKQLLDAIKSQKVNINFKGVGLGDSWISPMGSVHTWAPFLFMTGLIDQNGLKRLVSGAEKVQNAVTAGRFEEATDLWSALEVDIMRETSNVDFYNILYKVKPQFTFNENQPLDNFQNPRFGPEELQKLMEGPVKKALGIPPNVVHNKQSGEVFKALRGDFMKPVIHVVEDLLNNTSLQVVVFTGNLDLIVDTPGTFVWVENLRWKGANQWKSIRQKPIILKGYIEGYVKNVDNLYLYTVHRAGHMVSALQEMQRISDAMRKRRITFYGHLSRMDSGRLVKIFQYFQKRKIRPSWFLQTEKDLEELGVTKQDLQQRDKLRSKLEPQQFLPRVRLKTSVNN